MMAAAAQPTVADSNNLSLWGAAWHNLAVAQLNTALHSHHSYDVIRSSNDDTLLQHEQKFDSSNNNKSGNIIGSGIRTVTSNTNDDDGDDDESVNTVSFFQAQLNK